jgi:hypothetical protein
MRREHPSRFANAREAKEFLVSKIVEEAQREGVPLSEVERKMLYFSETHWTLPDMMEVNEAFDREYDQQQYEKKIAQFVRHARARARKENRQELEDWKDAIGILSKEDHYILLMLGSARASKGLPLTPLGLVVVLVALSLIVIVAIHSPEPPESSAVIGIPHPHSSRGPLGFYLWCLMTGLAVIYLLLWMLLGRQRVDNVVDKVLGALLR